MISEFFKNANRIQTQKICWSQLHIISRHSGKLSTILVLINGLIAMKLEMQAVFYIRFNFFIVIGS